ncbi:MAG: acylphosphatase, partial [Nitrososphaerales archaeon]
MVVRVRLVVEGEVQKVGYRDLVQRVARSLGVKGFVENLRDGNVQIVCEADNEALDNFVEKINVKEDLIDVESVRIVETSPAKGEFEYFDIKYGPLDEELGDRMVMAVNFAKATKKEIGEMRKDVKDVHTGIKDMHSDIKVMGTDIKEMGTDIKEMKTDMKEMKTDIKEMK